MRTVRSWLNNHSPLVTVLSVIVLILALGLVVDETLVHWRRSAPVADAWFYDLGTGQLFRAPGNALPPIQAPSGPLPNGEDAGVRARVFACGDCADPSNRFIGWLETLTPEMKYSIIHGQEGAWEGYSSSSMPYLDGVLVRAVGGDYWFKATSAEGRNLIEAPRKRCGPGVVLRSCFPE